MATTQQADESVRNYEIGYLISPTVPEGEVADIESDLHEAITAADGEVLASETPEARELAYTMEVTTSAGEREFERGQFGWVQLSVEKKELDTVKAVLEDEADVMRTLVTKIGEEDIKTNDGEGKTEEVAEEVSEEDDS